MATIGALRRIAPVEPKKAALPKAKMPPSEATAQYPRPSGVAAIPTTGAAKPSSVVPGTAVAVPNAVTAFGPGVPDSTCLATAADDGCDGLVPTPQQTATAS